MHPFKRSTLRYGRTPEPATPFRQPGQRRDRQLGEARRRARQWQFLALIAIAMAMALSGGLVFLAVFNGQAPFIVEVDEQGRARAIGPATGALTPTDAQIAYHLAAFIENVRGVAADPVVVRQNWLKAYDYASDRASVTLSDYARANDPFTKIGKSSIAVEVKSVVRASKDSFQLRWIERAYENGALASTRRFTGILSILLAPPKTAERIARNPLGIYVHDINWSEDLGTGGAE